MFWQEDKDFVHRYAVVSKELFSQNVVHEYDTKNAAAFLYESFFADRTLEDKSYAFQVCGDYPLKQQLMEAIYCWYFLFCMNNNKIYGIKAFAEKVLEPDYMEEMPYTKEEIFEVLELAATVEKFYKVSVVLRKYGSDDDVKLKCGVVFHHLMRVHARKKQLWDEKLQEDDPRYKLFQRSGNDWAEMPEWTDLPSSES